MKIRKYSMPTKNKNSANCLKELVETLQNRVIELEKKLAFTADYVHVGPYDIVYFRMRIDDKLRVISGPWWCWIGYFQHMVSGKCYSTLEACNQQEKD